MTRSAQKKSKLLQNLESLLGVKSSITVESVPTDADVVREADSVILYFESNGKGFERIRCANCKLVFAYRHGSSSVRCCSVECMRDRLKSFGMAWNPNAPLDRRWGRFTPVIVPPQALEILDELIQSPPSIKEKKTDPVENLDIFNLLGQLDEG